jgi:hypothetical protein
MNPGGLFVSSSGLVGIGNVVPAYTLDVSGTGRFTGALSGTSATFSGDLTIDTNTLYVDSTNNRLGIKTATPAFTLDVKGDMFVLTDITIEGKITGGGGIGSKMDIYASSNPSSTGVIKFYTANVERLQIGASGVTTIKGDGETLIQQATTANSYIVNSYYNSAGSRRGYLGFGGNSSSVFNVWNQENGDMTFGTNNTEKVRITSAGNVGIGTSTPTDFGATNTSLSINGRGGNAGLLDLQYNGTSGMVVYSDISGTTNYESRNLYMRFGTNNTERMRILANGNIAIGGTTSNEKLAIYGDMYVQTNMTIDGRITGGGGIASKMDIYAGSNTSGTGSIKFYTANTLKMEIKAGGYIDLNNVVYNDTMTSPRNLYIQSNGSIGGISSIRASKKNIQNVSNVDWLYQLNPVTFNYRKRDENRNYTEEIYDEITYGLIAEDTEPIAEFLINYDDSNSDKKMIGIEYSRLITPMLKAIQELKAEFDTYKTTHP